MTIESNKEALKDGNQQPTQGGFSLVVVWIKICKWNLKHAKTGKNGPATGDWHVQTADFGYKGVLIPTYTDIIYLLNQWPDHAFTTFAHCRQDVVRGVFHLTAGMVHRCPQPHSPDGSMMWSSKTEKSPFHHPPCHGWVGALAEAAGAASTEGPVPAKPQRRQ